MRQNPMYKYNPLPGVYLEEWSGVALLVWTGYVLLFLFLRRLIQTRGVSRWILAEGVLICFLADRFLALYSGECWRLTMEWDFYIRRWRAYVILLTVQILAGGAVLRWCRRKWGRRIGFGCILGAGLLIRFCSA